MLVGSVRLCRNDLVFEKKHFFSYVSGIFSCPLVSYMGYPPEAYFTGFGCGGIATIGADLVLGLIVIRVTGFSLLGCMLLCRGQLEFITIVSTQCNK